MQELTEIRFNDNRILLKDNLVKSPILPRIASELERDIVVQGNCLVEGAMFARTLEIQQGPFRVKGPIFTQLELHVNSDAKGELFFEKAAGSASAIVSLAPGCRAHFMADLSAKQVTLRNAYVSASIFADEITLEDCVVIGGVFATRNLELHNCIVGTFNSPTVRVSRAVYLLFPSAFSVERLSFLPGTEVYNLTLADLGALVRGTPQASNSGKIALNIAQDEVKAVLAGDGAQQILRTYSVVGKVLAADLADYDKLQNHFLISCASLSSQLLRTYDLGVDSQGNVVELTPQRIADAFFDILHGKTEIQDLAGNVDINSIVRGRYAHEMDQGSTPTSESPVAEENPASAETLGPQAPTDESSSANTNTQLETHSVPDSAAAPAEGSDCAQCSECGAPLDPGSQFCGSCGKRQT